MRHLIRERGLDDQIVVDSAGTDAYHAGEPPDARAVAAARRRGIEVGGTARRFRRADFARFDYVIAMDTDNYDRLRRLAPDAAARAKVHLLRSFDPNAGDDLDVPDPYYGGRAGFDRVLDLCDAACRGLLDRIAP